MRYDKVVKCNSCKKRFSKLDVYSISVRKHKGKHQITDIGGNVIKRPVYESTLIYFCKDCFKKETISRFIETR